jgi:chloride channel protein, CIC family
MEAESEVGEEPSTRTTPAAQANSEIQEYLQVSHRQHQLFPRAALVGVCAGSVAVTFRGLLTGADALRNMLVSWAHTVPLFGWVFPMAFSAAGATLGVALVYRYAPETSGSGIPHLKAVLHRLRDLVWFRVLVVKLVGGVLAIGSGLALGREGPTVQMGGAVGDGIARRLKASTPDRLTLTAAGAGAGLAAAFNAPLSGLVFILEEVQRDFRPAVFGAAFLAAAAADVVARLASGQLPVFTVPDYPVPPLTVLPVFIVLGCVAGALGVLFNRCLLQTVNYLAQFRGQSAFGIAATIGAIAGLIAWFFPLAVGGGQSLAETVLTGNMALGAIAIGFLLRFGLTLSSYGTGAAGGIFSPLLVLGALLGLAVGQVAHMVTPGLVPQPGVFAVVGMAAYFTAIVRAPLTGVVLILEMTGNYEQMLPLLASCFCAYAVAEYLKDVPIYEALLERDLLRRGIAADKREPMVIEFEVEDGAPFVGQEVRGLGLPAGCVLVRCNADGREWVPTAATTLQAHMRVTAVITPEAGDALAMLHRGCGSRGNGG